MKYCTSCGNQLQDSAAFCTRCGTACNGAAKTINVDTQTAKKLVTELSVKVKTNAIIWIVIGALQIFVGLFFQWFLAVVGALNIVSGIQDIDFSNKVCQKPEKIVERFEPLVLPIITLCYNLVFGGIIGVIGSIYYLVVIRNFVLTNKEKFLEIEKQAM